MTKEELQEILEAHGRWLWGKVDGRRADLRGANLQDADLRGANLRGANLRGANLQGANLWGADLQSVDLRDVDLRNADIRNAILWGINFTGVLGIVRLSNDEILFHFDGKTWLKDVTYGYRYTEIGITAFPLERDERTNNVSE